MSASHPGFDIREPISGYFTRELIGRGGFGEVWRAEAPGGLEKAIKIVHAGIDSKRAERELKALQRVKDVRHPLTLSIERIEILDGTLVIVTELADCSLKDVFKKRRSKGKPGIPRDQLLPLLRDAADALDYIYEEHSLQHLDIKPENLLVVGNRLKLGDFGLLKNIYERGASLVSGLTPTYAPPELFEGRPTRQSDQYSLAIVYQHMLTGELPFDGATSAQMAREHLSGVPRLSMLPRSERPIVARALSKVPGERFDRCAELIASLAAAAPDDPEDLEDEPDDDLDAHPTQTVSVAIPPVRAAEPDRPVPETGDETIAGFSPDGTSDPVLGAIELSLQPTRRFADSTSSGRSSAIPRAGFVPTVFLGVGGTGGLVLQELRRRIADAYGSLHAVPALQMVLMDTDGKQINSLMEREGNWEEVDVVALPLRRPQDYKFRESDLSKWLNRRWLYNIPRTLQTDGYRPFGRLALVDHGSRALVSIRTALTKATSAESVTQSAASTGLPFQQGRVRVVIVASISGGTGGGIALDLAYAVRGELKRRGCSDEDVVGILTHSTPGTPAERDKSLASAYSTLSELGHYSSPGHYYPGENAIKAPSFHGDNRTFGATYLVNLGEQLDASGWSAGASMIAEYLFCTTATPVKMVVDAARHADEGQSSESPSTVCLRSFDVRRLDHSNSREIADCIEQTCHDVVAMWQSGSAAVETASQTAPLDSTQLIELCATPVEPASKESPFAARTGQWLLDCGLEHFALRELACQIVEQEWGSSGEDHLRDLLKQLCEGGSQRRLPEHQLRDAADRLMDRVLGDVVDGISAQAEQTLILDRVRERLAERTADVAGQLKSHITALVDDPDGGVRAARAVADKIIEQLKELSSGLKHEPVDSASEAEEEEPSADAVRDSSWLRVFRRRPVEEGPSLLDEMLSGALDRLGEGQVAALQQYVTQIAVHVSTLNEQLKHLSRDLNCLSAEYQQPASRDESEPVQHVGPAARRYAETIHGALKQDRDRIARDVYEELRETVLAGEEKLRRFLGAHSQLQATLVTPLRNLARKVILSHVSQTTQHVIDESAQQSETGERTVCAELLAEFAHDRGLRTDAAGERMVVLVPESVDPQKVQGAFSSCDTLLPARTNGITICCEARPRPVEEVADELIERQELYRQLAEKLHLREDVRWTALSQPEEQPARPRGDVESVSAT